MASNPAGSTPADQPPPRTGIQEEDRSERYGALAVARHVKDDGRALILYTRAGERPT
ncbi:MAG: hypothetical protein ACRDLF_12605 [Solirubrobacteraceae bacterium]